MASKSLTLSAFCISKIPLKLLHGWNTLSFNVTLTWLREESSSILSGKSLIKVTERSKLPLMKIENKKKRFIKKQVTINIRTCQEASNKEIVYFYLHLFSKRENLVKSDNFFYIIHEFSTLKQKRKNFLL